MVLIHTYSQTHIYTQYTDMHRDIIINSYMHIESQDLQPTPETCTPMDSQRGIHTSTGVSDLGTGSDDFSSGIVGLTEYFFLYY